VWRLADCTLLAHPLALPDRYGASADRHDHRIMAGYPVHPRASAPVLTWGAARGMRDSGTLSGTSAEVSMTRKITPLRGRDTGTVQARATPLHVAAYLVTVF
jgi:hypothetical protein